MIYAAVASTPSRFYTALSPTVLPAHVEFDGARVHAPGHPAPGGFKLAATDTYRIAVMQSHDGRVLLVNHHGNGLDLAPSFGTNCVFIEALDEQHFRVCAITEPQTWTKYVVTGSLRNHWITGTFPVPENVGAGAGWLQVLDGQPVWTDAHRQWPAEGPAILTLPVLGTHYRVGQCNSHGRGGVDAVSLSTGELFHVSSQLSQLPPGYAERPDGSAMVAVSGDVAEFISNEQFKKLNDPAPDPQDPPPDDEEPMSSLPLKYRDLLHVAQEFDRLHPHLLQKAREQGEQFRKDYSDGLAVYINEQFETDKFGRKARIDGDLASRNDDALAYLIGPGRERKVLIDVVAGDDFHPAWDVRPDAEMFLPDGSPNGYWIAAPNAGTTDPDPGTGDDEPGDDVAAILADLVDAVDDNTTETKRLPPLMGEAMKTLFLMNEVQNAIADKLVALEAAVKALEAKQPPRYTGRVLGMGVTLTPVE